jgi:hypothetical protein
MTGTTSATKNRWIIGALFGSISPASCLPVENRGEMHRSGKIPGQTRQFAEKLQSGKLKQTVAEESMPLSGRRPAFITMPQLRWMQPVPSAFSASAFWLSSLGSRTAKHFEVFTGSNVWSNVIDSTDRNCGQMGRGGV